MTLREWWRRVRTPRWEGHRWQDRLFEGHVNIGRRVTIYGANAMHWAINVRFLGAFWCFHPTTRTYGSRWPWYFYVSRDATPTRPTFSAGPGMRNYG